MTTRATLIHTVAMDMVIPTTTHTTRTPTTRTPNILIQIIIHTLTNQARTMTAIASVTWLTLTTTVMRTTTATVTMTITATIRTTTTTIRTITQAIATATIVIGITLSQTTTTQISPPSTSTMASTESILPQTLYLPPTAMISIKTTPLFTTPARNQSTQQLIPMLISLTLSSKLMNSSRMEQLSAKILHGLPIHLAMVSIMSGKIKPEVEKPSKLFTTQMDTPSIISKLGAMLVLFALSLIMFTLGLMITQQVALLIVVR